MCMEILVGVLFGTRYVVFFVHLPGWLADYAAGYIFVVALPFALYYLVHL